MLRTGAKDGNAIIEPVDDLLRIGNGKNRSPFRGRNRLLGNTIAGWFLFCGVLTVLFSVITQVCQIKLQRITLKRLFFSVFLLTAENDGLIIQLIHQRFTVGLPPYQRFSTYSQKAYMSLISSTVPSSSVTWPLHRPCT